MGGLKRLVGCVDVKSSAAPVPLPAAAVPGAPLAESEQSLC